MLTAEKRKCIEECLKGGMSQKDTASHCRASLRDINKINKELERKAAGLVDLSAPGELIKLLWSLFRKKTPPEKISEKYGIDPEVVNEYQQKWAEQVFNNPYLNEIEVRVEKKYKNYLYEAYKLIKFQRGKIEDLKSIKTLYIDNFGGVHMEPPWLSRLVNNTLGRVSLMIIKDLQSNEESTVEDVARRLGFADTTIKDLVNKMNHLGIITISPRKTLGIAGDQGPSIPGAGDPGTWPM